MDISAIKALEQHSASGAHWNPKQYESLISASSRRSVLVIEDTSKQIIEGFLVARNSDGEWEIENVVVSDHSRRRGLGTRLLSEFLNHARQQAASAVFLEVRETNREARALYQKLHFKQIGRRKSYYRDPEEDAILYRLQFT